MRAQGITHLKTEDVEILLGPKPVEVPMPEPPTPEPPQVKPSETQEITPRRRLADIYSHPSIKQAVGQAHPDYR